MEANEISEFTEQVEKGGESHLQWVSLAISILAVLVAMVTVMGHRTHTEAVLNQAKASDIWNEYQAKKIRQSDLGAINQVLAALPKDADASREKAIEANKQHVEKWNDDLKENQEKAHEFDEKVEKAELKATRFDLGEALLQIAVVLSSITLLTKQRGFVFAGIGLGVVGLCIGASAFLIR